MDKNRKERAEFRVLLIPFFIDERSEVKVAVFKRKDRNYWQFIAGGEEQMRHHLLQPKKKTLMKQVFLKKVHI